MAQLAIIDGVTSHGLGGVEQALAKRRVQRAVGLFQLALDDEASERLGVSGIVVRIDVTDLPDQVITLLFDRTPAQAVGHRLPIREDVRLCMSSTDLDGMFREGEYLPMKILSGAVAFEGHVRKFLRILPILRGAATRQIDRSQGGGGRVARARGGVNRSLSATSLR